MKEKKPSEAELAGEEQARMGSEENQNGARRSGPSLLRPVPVDQNPLRSEATMHMETQPRRSRGRLNREVMNRLGKTLEAYYDDVRKEGVPDRFKLLLEQLEERKDKGSSG